MRLTAMYMMGRIAMDLASALLILYVSFWLGRSEEFESLMAVFLVAVIAALPLWLRVARGRHVRLPVLGALAARLEPG